MTQIQSFAASLSRVVAEELAQRGLSIRSLADQTGIPLVTLARRLNPTATSPLTVHEVDRIAAVMGIRPSDLMVTAEATPDLSVKSAS